MLSYEEKKEIFDSFPELASQEVSLNRLNYHFGDSAVPKTLVVKHLHPKSANAFVFAGYLPEEETRDGYVSVRDESDEEIRRLVAEALAFLRLTKDGYPEGYEEEWHDEREDELILRYTNEMWLVVMQSGAVEAVFKTKDQAEGYLMDEGFFETE